MIFVILSIIITGYLCWKVLMDESRSLEDWGIYITTIILSGLGGIIISLFVSLIICCSPNINVDYTLVDTQPIYAFEDNTTHNECYYLYSGIKNGNMTYFYIIEDKWGMKIESKNINYSYIIYDNTEKPRIEIYRGKWSNPFIKMLGFIGPKNRYKFFVPEGSLTNEINISVQ